MDVLNPRLAELLEVNAQLGPDSMIRPVERRWLTKAILRAAGYSGFVDQKAEMAETEHPERS